MGADSDPPYIYEASLQHKNRISYPYSSFNPRAQSQGSYAALSTTTDNPNAIKRPGPLIDFNRHPDSYVIVGGQNAKHKPMPANTKKKVKWVRICQLILRIFQEIGALGVLALVIFIRGMPVSLEWILRAAPGYDALITLYAIYHLARGVKTRPPASMASYQVFALIMDGTLVPFYVFTAICAENNYGLPVKNHLRWTSLFKTPEDTSIIFFSTFIASTAMGALHFISSLLDIWFIFVFRKISNLPPDMNPLEDNLTARPRRSNGHKYKSSEATATTDLLKEKDLKHLSGSTISVDRLSQVSVHELRYSEIPDPDKLPFTHSRTRSDDSFSAGTARFSRTRPNGADVYEQPRAARIPWETTERVTRAQPTSPSKIKSPSRETTVELPQTKRNHPPNGTNSSNANTSHYSRSALPNAAPSQTQVRSQQSDALLKDNWYVLEDDSPSFSNLSDRERRRILAEERDVARAQHPLRMNPPTPQNDSHANAEEDVFVDLSGKRSALTDRADKGNAAYLQRTETSATEKSSIYSESAPSLSSSTPKGKHYGNLTAATHGVRGKMSNHSLLATNAGYDATGLSAGDFGFATSPPPEKLMRGAARTPQKREGKGRVVSRTGVDVVDSTQFHADASRGYGMRERRDVSGKIAEEGRGGVWAGRSRW